MSDSDKFTTKRPCSPDEVPEWAKNGSKRNNRKNPALKPTILVEPYPLRTLVDQIFGPLGPGRSLWKNGDHE